MTFTASVQASIDHIARALAERPVGSTLREPTAPKVERVVEADDDPEPFRKALPHAGPWKCAAGCGALGPTPGVCEKCGDKAAREEARLEFKAALDSIPEAFRWARIDTPMLDARCGLTFSSDGISLSLSRVVVPRIVDRLLSGKVLNYVLRGANDAGKTSVACAVVQAIVDRGVESWIQFVRQRPGSRRVRMPKEPSIVTLARGARFVAARDVLPAKARGKDAPAPMADVAMGATLLVLDDIGEESPTLDGVYSAAERLQEMGNVVATRWDAERPIIGTMTRSDERILSLYGPGTHKRLVKSRRAKLIELELRGGKQ